MFYSKPVIIHRAFYPVCLGYIFGDPKKIYTSIVEVSLPSRETDVNPPSARGLVGTSVILHTSQIYPDAVIEQDINHAAHWAASWFDLRLGTGIGGKFEHWRPGVQIRRYSQVSAEDTPETTGQPLHHLPSYVQTLDIRFSPVEAVPARLCKFVQLNPMGVRLLQCSIET